MLVKYMTLLVLLACGMPAFAEIYQWIDSEGHTHYGDKAAKAAQPEQKAEKLAITEDPAKTDPEAERARQQLRMLDKLNSEQRETEAQRAVQAQQKHQQMQQHCQELQDKIRTEQQVAVMYRYDDAGKRVLWTDAERIAYREQLQATNQQYCVAAD